MLSKEILGLNPARNTALRATSGSPARAGRLDTPFLPRFCFFNMTTRGIISECCRLGSVANSVSPISSRWVRLHTGSPGSSLPQAEAAGAGTGRAQAEWQEIAPAAADSVSNGTHSGGEPSFGEQGIQSTCMAQRIWAGCLS